MAPRRLSPLLALAIIASRRMAVENSDWGAPKIHGELLKLGFEVSERTTRSRQALAGLSQ
jgi:hypothetical protein